MNHAAMVMQTGVQGATVRAIGAFGAASLLLVACTSASSEEDLASCWRIVRGAEPSVAVPREVSTAMGYVAMRRASAEGPSRETLCSLARIAPGVALSAAHCFVQPSDERRVAFPDRVDEADACRVAPVLALELHETLDVALVHYEELDASAPALDVETRPQPLGAALVLGGYGQDDTGRLGRVGFIHAGVVETTTEAFVVQGQPGTGPCVGDSGGPALVRRGDGSYAIAGTLSFGAFDCLGPDTYVDAAVFAPWARDL